ncbi:long-chain fatty acid--CoA ligase [Streptomyces sp. Pv4-95]|uniref:long-chain-fatty-acid--CoA ligase n=1 Tax=Streptomyces sp. Pv4-95 TaxID=3049543 RepID=UPI003891680E
MPNAAEAIWEHAWDTPERIALRGDTGEPWTYGTLRARSAAVAGRLREHGIRPGDRVLLVAPSVPEFAAAYYGILSAGAVAVTANTMAAPRELTYIGVDAGVSLVLGRRASTPAPEQVADELGVPYGELDPRLAGFTGLGDRGTESDSAISAPHPTEDDDTAVLLYTSGTTGRPKGAQLTHGNLVACAAVFCEVYEITAEDRAVTGLPLFHVFGQVCVMATTMHAGASLSLLERFDAPSMLAMLRRDRPTFTAGVPTMWNALLRASDAADAADFTGLRLASSGGASLPVEVMRAFEERFGCAIVEGYGLTETAGAATFQDPRRPRKPGGVGRALPGCEVSVRGDDGAELPPGGIGEVYVKGPVVMKGYWNRPEATADVLHDGRLATGDLGTMDADGDLRIVDRKKDLVIRGGYNVYPREVEEVLYEHPDIVEAAVIGIPDAHYGEEVAAVVALRPGARLSGPDLRRWAKERLSAYKVPHVVAVVDELPKGPTGKILKRAIDPVALKAEPTDAALGPADATDPSDTAAPGNCTPSGGH